MSHESLPFLRLLLDASWVVQFVLVLLGIASIGSWSIIISKSSLLARARRESEGFEAKFWSGGDLGTLYRSLEAKGGSQGMSNIFEMGFREFARLRQSGATRRPAAGRRAARDEGRPDQGARWPGAQPCDAGHHRLGEPLRRPVRHGLGIMNTFVALGDKQQATLATVAPGIAEALVATAFALVAAIPAFIAYNRYADKVSRLELRYNAFMEEFSTILQRHASRPPGAAEGLSKP